MRLYAHWLDGEYLRIAHSQRRKIGFSPLMLSERLLKLHALIGTEFVLSDVQTIDSYPILKIFANQEFRDFLSRYSNFMGLVAKPALPSEESKVAVAEAGLHRCLKKGWASSAFENPQATVQLANAILDHPASDVEALLRDARQGHIGDVLLRNASSSQHKLLLEGMVRAFHYFAHDPKSLVIPAGNDRQTPTYYDVLVEFLNRDLPPTIRQQIEETKFFVDTAVPDPHDRGRRSLVLGQLATVSRIKQEQFWNNIIQAWNCAVQDTLAPDGGSAAWLPGSVTIETRRHQPISAIVPIRGQGRTSKATFSPTSSIAKRGQLLDLLSWKRLSELIDNTIETQRLLQQAMAMGEEEKIANAIYAHAKAIGSQLSELPQLQVRDWVWALTILPAYVLTGDIKLSFSVVAITQRTYPSVVLELEKINGFFIANTLSKVIDSSIEVR